MKFRSELNFFVCDYIALEITIFLCAKISFGLDTYMHYKDFLDISCSIPINQKKKLRAKGVDILNVLIIYTKFCNYVCDKCY